MSQHVGCSFLNTKEILVGAGGNLYVEDEEGDEKNRDLEDPGLGSYQLENKSGRRPRGLGRKEIGPCAALAGRGRDS